MPAKFKPSERVYAKNSRGARMSTQPRSRSFKHYYLKNTSEQELLDATSHDKDSKIKELQEELSQLEDSYLRELLL